MSLPFYPPLPSAPADVPEVVIPAPIPRVSVLEPIQTKLLQYNDSATWYQRGRNFFEFPEIVVSAILTTVGSISLSADVVWYQAALIGSLVLSGSNFLVGCMRKFFSSKFNQYNSARIELEDLKIKLLDAMYKRDDIALEQLKSQAADLLRRLE